MRDKERRSGKNQPEVIEKKWTPLELAEMKTGRRMGQIHQAKGVSSRRRIKVEKGTACYHVMSRTVNGEFLFGDQEKEAFRRMMWSMAKFAGVEILTYAVMNNHFHILVKVPDQEKWIKRFEGEDGEEKLLEHLSVVYSKAFLRQLRSEIDLLRKQKREKEIIALLKRFTNRFCDVSLFVKELKERFTRWFNKMHGRRGTLWMDRFQSVLVQDRSGDAASGSALLTMAAYIDLNPVRAGIVNDPAQYAWSGYGEAFGGSRRARRGLCKTLGVPQDSWEAQGGGAYRCWLYHEGLSVEEADPKNPGRTQRKKRRGFSVEEYSKVQEQEGYLKKTVPVLPNQPPSGLLRKRVSVFSTGVAVGSAAYVQEISAWYRDGFKRKYTKKEKPIGATDHEGGEVLFSLRRFDNLKKIDAPFQKLSPNSSISPKTPGDELA